MTLDTIGLEIGRVGRTLIPFHAEPFQIGEDLLERFLCRSLAIGIVDTQDELAARVTRVEIRKKARADVADMQRAGRAWRETSTDCVCHSHSIVAGGLEVMS